jgi:tetratricopeptide (TPR) repeat protein
MPRLGSVLVFAAVLCAAQMTRAGTFGGFSSDRGSYLSGETQVCTPLDVAQADSAAAPTCKRGSVSDIAEAKFRKGARQSGASGYRAEGRGTRIQVFGPGGDEPIVRWDAGGVVSRVVATYAVDEGALVAVEFESRRFGRLETDSVVFRLRAAVASVVDPDAPTEDAHSKAERARARADALARKRKWKKAEQAYREALDLDATDVAARYGLAVVLAKRKKLNEALRELRTLSKSSSDQAIVWLVEARTAKAFKKLRKRDEFRRAVGLERSEGQPLTAYERLLDPKSGWEQPRVACEEAGVALSLTRKGHKFRIKITTECQGYEETVRLDGTWQTQGASYLRLTFPNVDGPDETTRCEIRTCADGSGEDCVSCQVDRDLGFTLRPVRR